jgi:hypothetical protein
MNARRTNGAGNAMDRIRIGRAMPNVHGPRNKLKPSYKYISIMSPLCNSWIEAYLMSLASAPARH